MNMPNQTPRQPHCASGNSGSDRGASTNTGPRLRSRRSRTSFSFGVGIGPFTSNVTYANSLGSDSSN
jgi:hypothetical protein